MKTQENKSKKEEFLQFSYMLHFPPPSRGVLEVFRSPSLLLFWNIGDKLWFKFVKVFSFFLYRIMCVLCEFVCVSSCIYTALKILPNF